MPELPEVETIKLSLEPFLLNKKIEKVDIMESRLRFPVVKEDFELWVSGQKIIAIRRRAKYLIWDLDNNAGVIIHLGMSGRLGYFRSQDPVERHTHVVFYLSMGHIRYRDPRRFGFIEVRKPGDKNFYKRFLHLGVEPLQDNFNAEYLKQKTAHSIRPVKNILMDATIVVGIGNIYANESLFFAGIHPATPAKELSHLQREALIHSVKKVLKKAIEKGGTTLNDYRNANGEPGFFQLDLSVYGRENEACPRCNQLIRKIVLSGRSSFYCPACQKIVTVS